MRRYHGFVRLKASSYFLAGGDADDLVQEGMIGLYKAIRDFRLGQGDVVPLVRRALRHPADHHRDQVGDALQARPAEHVRLVQPHAGGSGHRRRLHARRCAARPVDRRPVRARDLDRGAAGARRLPRHDACPGSSRRRSACYLDGNSYESMAEASTATARRSTTPCSASSGRSSRTRRRAPFPLEQRRCPETGRRIAP